jgi:hypothetical protein
MNRLLSPWVALVGFLVVAAFFLFGEHRAHFFGVVPYLLLLACLLLHFFVHGGHGRHDSHGGSGQDTDTEAHTPRHGRGTGPSS